MKREIRTITCSAYNSSPYALDQTIAKATAKLDEENFSIEDIKFSTSAYWDDQKRKEKMISSALVIGARIVSET